MQRVAKKYFTKENRSVVITMPKAGRRAEGRPAMKRHGIRRLRSSPRSASRRRGAAGATGAAPVRPRPKGPVLKNKAPVSKEILSVTLPKPQEADLSNGVHLIVLEDHRTPQVNFQMIIDGAGGYYDPASMPGLADVHRRR